MSDCIEYEMKAWVKDPIVLQGKLDNTYRFCRTVEKLDIYFAPSYIPLDALNLQNDPIFRLREIDNAFLVTCKRRNMIDGMERNVEDEFHIAGKSKEAFTKFADFIGYRPIIEKRKITRIYRDDGHAEFSVLNIELNEVPLLGHFLELENLSSPVDEFKAGRLHKRFDEIFSQMGIQPSQIETRPYVDLLRDANR
jgi:predicted adenylyl cyclase CyaB